MTQHTIVQHSGFGYGGNPQFERAVESRHVTPAQAKVVERAGGVVFPDYSMAEDFCELANYPPEIEGLIPEVKGSFSEKKIDQLAIYIPAREVVG